MLNKKALGPDHPDVAKILNNLAELYRAQGRYEEAEPLYERSRAIAEKALGPDHPAVGTSLNNLAELYRAQGRYEEAEPFLKRALVLNKKALGPDHPAVATSLSNLAWLVVSSGEGDRRTARARFELAARIREAAGARGDLFLPLAGAGLLAEQERGWPEAARLYGEAVEAVEAIRGSLGERVQTTFMRDKLWIYEALQRVLHHLHQQSPGAGHDRKMFAASERGKARTLLELLGEARAGLLDSAPDAWRRKRHVAIAVLNGAQQVLAQKELTEEERKLQLERLREAEIELDHLDRELRRVSPVVASVEAPEPMNVGLLQREVLRRGEVLLSYSLGEESSFLYLVSPETYQVKSLPAQEEIRSLVGSLWADSSRRGMLPGSREIGGLSTGQVEEDLSKAAEMLLGPAAGLLDPGMRLIIVPDDALFYLPFELLGDVLEDHSVSYSPSASVLALSRKLERGSEAQQELLAMAPFVNDSALGEASRHLGVYSRDGWRPEPLPFTGREVRAIGGLFSAEKVSVRLGAEAQEAVLKGPEAKDYRRIHLATYAFANPEFPRRSSVILSQADLGSDEDGLLSLYEVFHLKLDADLVVLSACETGLGKLEKGEGMIELTRGFLYAGARSLVVSLWPVNDQSTAILMERFYRNLKEGKPKAEALRLAKLSLRDDPDMPELHDPFHWAPFILVGEGW